MCVLYRSRDPLTDRTVVYCTVNPPPPIELQRAPPPGHDVTHFSPALRNCPVVDNALQQMHISCHRRRLAVQQH